VDKIYIKDIKLGCVIGIYTEERSKKQDVIVNVTLHCDLARAGRTDDMVDTVDYFAVEQAMVSLIKDSEFKLLEALAHSIADVCLAFDGVEQVDVTVEKPGALRFARSVSVEISRHI